MKVYDFVGTNLLINMFNGAIKRMLTSSWALYFGQFGGGKRDYTFFDGHLVPIACKFSYVFK
ncbi:MAG: hypothetical protein CMC13_04625 [Flavobacteriaceae bacterium]|nr:hypothetical protein [Flavobacteriaceae bacterium]